MHRVGVERLDYSRDRSEAGHLHCDNRRDVLRGNPELPIVIRVPREDYLTPSDTLQLPESTQKVSPVVDSKNRHHRIEADIGEGETLGLSSDPTGTGVLGKHDGGRLNRDDLAVRGFVRAGSGPHIQDRLGIAERLLNDPP